MNRLLKNGLISASRRRRLASALYESTLLFGVLFISGYLFDTLTHSTHFLDLRHTRQLWFFTVLGIYFMWFWCHGGQTLAMKTWHVRLVNQDGHSVGGLQALFRYLLCWPFMPTGIALVYSFFDKQGQFPQDRLARTLLVSAHPT